MGLFQGVLLACLAYLFPIGVALLWARQAAYDYFRLHPEKTEFFPPDRQQRSRLWPSSWRRLPKLAFVTRESMWQVRHSDPVLERARMTVVVRQRVVMLLALLGWLWFLPIANVRF